MVKMSTMVVVRVFVDSKKQNMNYQMLPKSTMKRIMSDNGGEKKSAINRISE